MHLTYFFPLLLAVLWFQCQCAPRFRFRYIYLSSRGWGSRFPPAQQMYLYLRQHVHGLAPGSCCLPCGRGIGTSKCSSAENIIPAEATSIPTAPSCLFYRGCCGSSHRCSLASQGCRDNLQQAAGKMLSFCRGLIRLWIAAVERAYLLCHVVHVTQAQYEQKGTAGCGAGTGLLQLCYPRLARAW